MWWIDKIAMFLWPINIINKIKTLSEKGRPAMRVGFFIVNEG